MEGMVAFQSVDGICPIDCVETDGAVLISIDGNEEKENKTHQIKVVSTPPDNFIRSHLSFHHAMKEVFGAHLSSLLSLDSLVAIENLALLTLTSSSWLVLLAGLGSRWIIMMDTLLIH